MQRFAALFRPTTPIPAQYRANFRHLILDVAWFGVLSGTAISFLPVYATRLGASSWQIGLLSAAPAVVNLLFTLPASNYLQNRPVDRAVFHTAFLHRIFYLALIPMAWLFAPASQVWMILGITMLMTIPGTYLSVGFNSLFAEAVVPEWRSYIVGARNALLALVTTLTTLASGWILTNLIFPAGYQLVFGIGFLGAAFSTYHLNQVRLSRLGSQQARLNLPAQAQVPVENLHHGFWQKIMQRVSRMLRIRVELLSGPFGRVILLLFSFHLAQFLAIPVFPLYYVNELNFSDEIIGLGTALFNLTVFLGSTQLIRITSRWSYQQTTGVGVIILGLYPGMLTFSQTLPLFAVTSLTGGLAWALVGGALYNYLMERVPPDDRPAHLAWYNLALNAAILIGTLTGSTIAGQIGLGPALLVFAVCRSLAGIAILRWG